MLRLWNHGEISFLDAQKVQSGHDLPHSEMLYYRLLVYDETMMDPRPDLAESWTVSDDGTTYVFKLREDAVFHNGRNITAADVRLQLGSIHAMRSAIRAAAKGN